MTNFCVSVIALTSILLAINVLLLMRRINRLEKELFGRKIDET